MIDALDAASKVLEDALENYLRVCSTIPTWLAPSSGAFGTHVLADWVSKELPLVTSYEATIQKAKTIISQARNSSTPLSPINVLPDEILSRIFHLALESKPEKISGDLTASITRNPEILSHVCTHWRRIAIGLPSLWSYIDIVPPLDLNQQPFQRGEAFAHRSKNLPITLQINDFHSYISLSHSYLRVFCSSVSTRIRDVRVRCHSSARGGCQLLLKAWPVYCTPGALQSLYLRDSCECYLNHFIDSPSPQHESDTLQLNVPVGFVEQLLRPVRRLYLDGCLFHWDSGLTELQIAGTTIEISPHKLVQILKASPQLRVLHFGVLISDLSLDENLTPAHLPHLEVLNLCWLESFMYPLFFSLLAPDTEPLQLSLWFDDPRLLSVPISRDFFQHSNITEFYMDGPAKAQVCLSDILDLLPKLQILSIANFQLYGHQLCRIGGQSDGMPNGTLPRIEIMRLTSCSVGLDATRLMTRRYSIRKMILWDCDWLDGENWDGKFYASNTDHTGAIERRRGCFPDTGVFVQIVGPPLPVSSRRLSADWEKWHPWKSWP